MFVNVREEKRRERIKNLLKMNFQQDNACTERNHHSPQTASKLLSLCNSVKLILLLALIHADDQRVGFRVLSLGFHAMRVVRAVDEMRYELVDFEACWIMTKTHK